MKTIKKTYKIDTPIKKVWDALTKPAHIEAWGGGPNVVMNDEVGSEFLLWDGEIHGTNTEVVPEKRLVQEWFSDNDGFKQASIAMFTLKEEDGKTVLELKHVNVPDDAAKNIESGWDEYYIGPLKEYVESA